MPPWLESPEGVAAFIAALLGLLATIGVGIIGAVAAVMVAWRSKLKPLLMGTQQAAQSAAHELKANHGSSTRDAVNRTEMTVNRLAEDLREMRTEQRSDREAGNRAHSEIFRRLRSIESPMEDTRP